MYEPEAEERIAWIIKLQAIGFTLAEIQEFVKAFELAPSGREATARARAVFTEKLTEIREQITRLRSIENDLSEALEYLEACQECSPEYAPTECNVCQHHGHERGTAPPLFANLSESAAEDVLEEPAHGFDVPVQKLESGSRRAKTDGSGKPDSTDKGSN